MINIEDKCSFCFKKKSEVKVLIKGEAKGKVSFICDGCVAAAKKFLNKPVEDLVS